MERYRNSPRSAQKVNQTFSRRSCWEQMDFPMSMVTSFHLQRKVNHCWTWSGLPFLAITQPFMIRLAGWESPECSSNRKMNISKINNQFSMTLLSSPLIFATMRWEKNDTKLYLAAFHLWISNWAATPNKGWWLLLVRSCCLEDWC